MNIIIESPESGALYVLLSGILAALITGLFSLIITRKQNETTLKEIAVKLGLEEFSFAANYAKERHERSFPPEYFVYLSYVALKAANKLSAENQKGLKAFWIKHNNTAEFLGTVIKEIEQESTNPKEKPNDNRKPGNDYRLIESAVVLGIIASLTAFVIGYIFGAKIGL